MLQILLVLILAAHLLTANLAGASPLVCLWLDRREQRGQDVVAGELGRFLLRQSLLWLTVAMLLGAATLTLVWLTDWEPFAAAARRVPPSRFWWSAAELVAYYACVAGYLALWRGGIASTGAKVVLRRVLAVLASTNLLYHFPLLFTVIGVLGARAGDNPAPISFGRELLDPEIFSQFAHHVLASFAVVGVAMMGYALRLERKGGAADDVRRVATWGGRTALVPTVLQLLVGVYVLLELPPHARDELLGGDLVASLLFGASLVAAIALLHRLVGVSLGETDRRSLIGSMVLLVIVVVAMVGTRTRSRQDRMGTATGENRPIAARFVQL